MVFLSVAVFAVVTFQWFFWGYSLTFSSTGGAYIGDLKHFGFINVLEQPSSGSGQDSCSRLRHLSVDVRGGDGTFAANETSKHHPQL